MRTLKYRCSSWEAILMSSCTPPPVLNKGIRQDLLQDNSMPIYFATSCMNTTSQMFGITKTLRGTFHRGTYTATLDYLFIPEFLLPSVSAIDIVPEPLSDHSSIHLDFSFASRARGPGFWRFNNLLLSNSTFLQDM